MHSQQAPLDSGDDMLQWLCLCYNYLGLTKARVTHHWLYLTIWYLLYISSLGGRANKRAVNNSHTRSPQAVNQTDKCTLRCVKRLRAELIQYIQQKLRPEKNPVWRSSLKPQEKSWEHRNLMTPKQAWSVKSCSFQGTAEPTRETKLLTFVAMIDNHIYWFTEGSH